MELKEYDNIKLYKGDCMDLMAQTPDKYYDLAIVDPPYGINYEDGGQYFKSKNKMIGKKWDSKPPTDDYFKELQRVSKNQIIWGGNYFDLPPTRCVLAWTKTAEVQDRTFSEWEMAWTSFNTIAKYYNLKPFIRGGYRIHPTEKPIQLYEWLLKHYAKENDKIIDTHLGSGSIVVAVDKMNKINNMSLQFTGIELDEDYYNAMIKRFENYNSQTTLNFE